MNTKSKVTQYLEYCEFRKELDRKTLKAYRIDIRQFFEFVTIENPEKEEIELYVTELHKKYKQKLQLPRIVPRNDIESLLNYMYANLYKGESATGENRLRDVAIIEVFFATGARV